MSLCRYIRTLREIRNYWLETYKETGRTVFLWDANHAGDVMAHYAQLTLS